MIEMEVKGFKELEDALKDVAAKIEARIIRKALRAGVEVKQKLAVNYAPESDISYRSPKQKKWGADKPGNLKSKIVIKSAGKEKESGGVRVRLVALPWYAKFVEYGTSKMSAQPFMRPALEQDDAQFMEAIGEVFTKELDKL